MIKSAFAGESFDFPLPLGVVFVLDNTTEAKLLHAIELKSRAAANYSPPRCRKANIQDAARAQL
jgi:hypothetical protein